jgi:hypothetical protein
LWCAGGEEEAADEDAILQHVVVVIGVGSLPVQR